MELKFRSLNSPHFFLLFPLNAKFKSILLSHRSRATDRVRVEWRHFKNKGFKIFNVSAAIVSEKNSLKWWINYVGLETQWQNKQLSGVHLYFLNVDFSIDLIVIQFQINGTLQV